MLPFRPPDTRQLEALRSRRVSRACGLDMDRSGISISISISFEAAAWGMKMMTSMTQTDQLEAQGQAGPLHLSSCFRRRAAAPALAHLPIAWSLQARAARCPTLHQRPCKALSIVWQLT